jgi:hypothetical protein
LIIRQYLKWLIKNVALKKAVLHKINKRGSLGGAGRGEGEQLRK